MLKRCVFGLRLKMGRVFVDLTDSGRLLRTAGLATKKARSPNLVQSASTAYHPTSSPVNTTCNFQNMLSHLAELIDETSAY